MSDLDKFEEAYEEFGKLTKGVDSKVLDRHLSGHTSDNVAGLLLAGGFTHAIPPRWRMYPRPGRWQD